MAWPGDFEWADIGCQPAKYTIRCRVTLAWRMRESRWFRARHKAVRRAFNLIHTRKRRAQVNVRAVSQNKCLANQEQMQYDLGSLLLNGITEAGEAMAPSGLSSAFIYLV